MTEFRIKSHGLDSNIITTHLPFTLQLLEASFLHLWCGNNNIQVTELCGFKEYIRHKPVLEERNVTFYYFL